MSEHRIDFLRARLGPSEHVEGVGHGEWSRAYLAGQKVVRFSATDDDFLKDQLAERLAAGRLPIPHLTEIGRTDDEYFAISERAYGTFLEERDAAAMQRVLPSLLATLDDLREVDVSSTGGFGLWRGSDSRGLFESWREALLTIAPSPRTIGWRDALARTPEAQRAFDLGYARLAELLDACPNERHLIHSDLLYFNVLVQTDAISAVLDWGSSMYGDFLWDVAWLTFWQAWYTAWSAVDIRGAARAHYAAIGLAVPNFEARLRCYELAIGLDGLAYQAWANKLEELAWTTRHVRSLIG